MQRHDRQLEAEAQQQKNKHPAAGLGSEGNVGEIGVAEAEAVAVHPAQRQYSAQEAEA